MKIINYVVPTKHTVELPEHIIKMVLFLTKTHNKDSKKAAVELVMESVELDINHATMVVETVAQNERNKGNIDVRAANLQELGYKVTQTFE